jgi:ppGpp synthetase/RelA/SpoT-type nucleotidyltranferase
LKTVTDMAGVRVITFFPKTVNEVDAVIRDRFRVLEKDNKSESRAASNSFGYRSVHYLVELAPEHLDRSDRRWFQGLVAEIQVRTILQHAWAEIEHDIQYKSVRAIPAGIRRRLAAVAGLLEIADREFQAIQDEDERHRKHLTM